MITFLITPVGQFLLKILMIILSVSGLWVAWILHDQSIRNSALLEFNKKQMIQNTKDQEQYQKNIDILIDQQKMILQSLDIQEKKLQGKTKVIVKYLNAQESSKSAKPVSNIIKNVVKQLGQ